MQTISTRRASELGDQARSAIESLLGRKVSDEEQVTVMSFPVSGLAAEDERKQAAKELIGELDSLAASARHIPKEEMEALLDEAIEHVRPRRS